MQTIVLWLAASVWTENIKKGHYIASKLQAGTVWINDFGLEWETMPFGGYKQSGIGREMGGEYGLAKLYGSEKCIC